MSALDANDPTWWPIVSQLGGEIAPVFGPEFVKKLGEPWSARVLWVRNSTFDLMHSMRLYFLGFEVAKTDPQKVTEPTRGWVLAANTRTSANLQMCILASGLCTILESIIREMAEAFVQDVDVQRVSRRRTLERDPEKARKQLVRWTSPTSMAEPETWCERLADVFEITLSTAAKTSLVSLVTLRHLYIHDRGTVLARQTTPDEANSWSLAVMLLTTLVGQSVSVRASSTNTA